MAVNDAIQLRFVCSTSDQISLNIRQFLITDVQGVEATPQEIADYFSTSAGPQYRGLLSEDAHYDGVALRMLPFGGIPSDWQSKLEAGVGGVVGPLLPKQSCGLLSLRSTALGRRGRGRVYIPFPSEEDNVTGGIPSVDYVVRVEVLSDTIAEAAFVGAVPNVTTLTPMLFSRDTGVYTPIVATLARSLWATQRRRGDFGKQNVSPIV